MKKIIFLFFVLVLLSTIDYRLVTSEAAVPHLINYQGRLTDSSGVPLNGSYSLTFKIYDAESAGNLLWQGTYTAVTITKGVFSILLGDINDSGFNFATLAFDKPYFLEIKVGNEVMSPRQRITSAGYAIRAEESEKLGGKNSSDYALATDITSTPTANKAVRLNANAKLPFSALKVYDSGWIPVSVGGNYTITHNLGTTKLMILTYSARDASGTNMQWQGIYHVSTYNGFVVYDITPTQLTLRVATSGQMNYVPQVRDGVNSGYARVIIMALE